MTVPRATYRLQFNKHFTFRDATALVPYFSALGISHIYASPILTARPGSLHGYDIVDPSRVNPELGGEEEFQRLVQELRRHGMGVIVDIVPNHMAATPLNSWWLDVLAHGEASRFAKYFDIDWSPIDSRLRGKVLLPVLRKPYGDALAAGEIRLEPRDDAGLFVRYFDSLYPLNEQTAHEVSSATLDDYNPGDSDGRQRLHGILERQHYRLSWWRLANDEINWRRFFDINDLVAVRVEDDDVFEAMHAKTLQLYAAGLIDGVRVDHVDGLTDPGTYCRTLRRRLRELEGERPASAPKGPAYLIVEKILSRDEILEADWETDGTTGYDFMDEVDALQHDPSGERQLNMFWERVSGRPADFDAEEIAARREILDRNFSAQRNNAVRAIFAALQGDIYLRDISFAAVRRCLTEILAHFPVYRIYTRIGHASQTDAHFLARAIEGARRTALAPDQWLVKRLGRWLGGERIGSGEGGSRNRAMAMAQQLSAALCAKAVEDTAFYRYGRLLSRNDVGFDVRRFSLSAAEFHDRMRRRAERYPRTMLATATHDHKRGEDSRCRLATLSELAEDWTEAVVQWLAMARAGGERFDGSRTLEDGHLVILFQSIVGAWPMGLELEDRAGLKDFGKRIVAWQQKALREAKLRTEWAVPNEAYENAAATFVEHLFAAPSELLQSIHRFVERIAAAGAVNGLAQLLIKLTAPGIPDIYQGTEYWDLSLVDPDNRSPVDFAARKGSLGEHSVHDLVSHWRTGHLKQYVAARSLALRKAFPETFAQGDYIALEAVGPAAEHIVAFARVQPQCSTVTAVCRLVARAVDSGLCTVPVAFWAGTRLMIPPPLRIPFNDALVPKRHFATHNEIEATQLFENLPVALLTTQQLQHS